MDKGKDEHSISSSRDAQIDLFTLIGGSWPPAPREPKHPEYRSAPVSIPRRHTMQRSSQNDRVKSVNLIEHIVTDRRRNKPQTSVHFEEPLSTKMVHEPKKIDTGVLVDVCSEGPQNVHSSAMGSPHTSSTSRPSTIVRNQESIGSRGGSNSDQPYGDVRWIGIVSADGRPADASLEQRSTDLSEYLRSDMAYPYYLQYLEPMPIDQIPLCVLELENEVGNNENTEELYDSPVLGSPRVAPPQKSSSIPAGVLQDEIGVGSLVEVATDVDQHHYGVVRWIGIIDDTPTAGVELEQSVCGLGDGSCGGSRLFSCASGRALFVPLPLCRRDARFRDTPPPDAPQHTDDSFSQPDCPVVPGVIPPLSSIGELAGKNRGIQGHHNSCYLDATLFAMFTFTSVFDALLYRPPEPEDSPHYSEVQRVLREQIVNPLRRHGYVRADRVMKLRTLLERLSDVPGLTSEEKDPEEFLNGLVAQLLRAEPFLKLSSGQESYCYQLFVEKDEHVSLPTVQQLLEQSFATSGVKLSEVPSTLIIQMPRFGKQYKLYQQVLPSPLLDVTDLIEGLPRQCAVCGSLARWECSACAAPDGGVLEAGAFCAQCLRVVHNSRPQHKPTPLTVAEEYISIMESCTLPRVYMELFAVLCIETSHYVAFVKAGAGIDAPWCFFDSMADRKGERNGYNIPEIVSIDDLGAWLGEESERAALRDAAPAARPRPLHARRLLSDAYMCFYRSPDVAMYR